MTQHRDVPRRRPIRSSWVAGGLILAFVGALLPPQSAAAARPAAPFDVNGDGYADLVTGVPGEPVGGKRQAGAIQVILGSKEGLTATSAQLWSRATAGVTGDPTESEELGRGVASADFDSDGYADVAPDLHAGGDRLRRSERPVRAYPGAETRPPV